MINSINPYSLPNVQNVNIQGANDAVKINQQPMTNPVQNTNLNGADALASYNRAYVAPNTKMHKLEPSLPTVLQPEAIKLLKEKGACIKRANGVLDSIVEKNDKTTTVYTMDVLAPDDAIGKIETFDNATGKLICRQENINDIKEGQMPVIKTIGITKYDPQTGEETARTRYYDGNVFSTSEYEILPSGAKRTYTRNFETNTTSIFDVDNQNQTCSEMRYDKDGKLIETVNKDWANYTTEITHYKDGHIVASKEVKKHEPIPNTTGIDPKGDPQFTPAAPVQLNYDPTKVEGEKIYYNNGVLEGVKTQTAQGEVSHCFRPNGTLESISYDLDKKFISFGEDYQSIKEEIAPNIFKTTTYYYGKDNNGSVEVIIANNNDKTEKGVCHQNDGTLIYTEFSKDSRLFMEFDKQGNLREFDNTPDMKN